MTSACTLSTGQNTAKARDSKPHETPVAFRKIPNNTLNFLGNKTVQKSQKTVASKQWFECNGKRAANLFGHDACIRKESGEKEVSLRTIAQDLTSFSKFDHSGYWWDVTQV